jgi:hypothetical protein
MHPRHRLQRLPERILPLADHLNLSQEVTDDWSVYGRY